jgi:hypothetical protein
MNERLKVKAARSLDALEEELKPVLDTAIAKDAKGSFKDFGNALH